MVVATDTEKSPTNTLKFLCNYGGKIVPRRTDGKLRYVVGHTRVLAVDRAVSFTELMVKLVEFCGSSVVLRCTLPNEGFELLISVRSDEDLANVVKLYDQASSSLPHPLKIGAVLSQLRSNKIVSPPPSIASGVAPYISRFSSPSVGFPAQRCSPAVGYPVGVPFFSDVRGNPKKLYCNHRQ